MREAQSSAASLTAISTLCRRFLKRRCPRIDAYRAVEHRRPPSPVVGVGTGILVTPSPLVRLAQFSVDNGMSSLKSLVSKLALIALFELESDRTAAKGQLEVEPPRKFPYSRCSKSRGRHFALQACCAPAMLN